MKKEETISGFYTLSQSWYVDACKKDNIAEEIMVGSYCPDGGCEFEFKFAWHILGDRNSIDYPAMRIDVFEDSFIAFRKFALLFSRLSKLNNKEPQPKEIIDLLTKLGFKDLTKRERE